MIRRGYADHVFEWGRRAHLLTAYPAERDPYRDPLQPAEQRAAVLVPSQRLRQTDKDIVLQSDDSVIVGSRLINF